MQKSRLCEKYNAMRHPKDPFYSKYTIKCFLSKFTRSGSSATGHRQVERSLRISKTVNFKVINEIKASDLVLRKKRTNVILHKRSYLLRTFYSYLRGRLTTFKMLQKALRNLWVPLELARSRRGKQVIFIPVPTRRNKKTIIARHWLFHSAFTAIDRRRMYYQLALDLTGALVFSRSSLALKKKRQTLDALYEHRTELERRWR